MPIRITCPSCQRSLKVADQSTGKRLKCPACGEEINVPSATTKGEGDAPLKLIDEPLPEVPRPSLPVFDTEVEEDKPRRRRWLADDESIPPKGGKVAQIAGILGIVAAMVAIVLYARPWAPKKEPFSDWGWVAYSPPDRSFQVEFPQGKIETSGKALNEVATISWGVALEGGKYNFLIMRAEATPNQPEPNVDQAMGRLREIMLKRLPNGRVKSEGAATLGGQPCKELVMGTLVDPGMAVEAAARAYRGHGDLSILLRVGAVGDVIVRACRRGPHLYYVLVGGEYFNQESLPVRRYLDSFRFLDPQPAKDGGAKQP